MKQMRLRNLLIGWTLGGIAIIIAWAILGYGPSWPHVSLKAGFGDLATAGQFGDSFGFANSFFSALAFFGVLLTIHLQMKEMQDTRGEQEEMRRSMRLQADSAFLANYFEIELRLANAKNDFAELYSGPIPADTAYLRDQKAGRIKSLIAPLERSFELMKPHAEKIMNRMGVIMKNESGAGVHHIKGDYL